MLTIAGSDSGGGAGIQADMRTSRCWVCTHWCAVTAVTVQNSLGVKGFHEVPDDVIAAQIEAVVVTTSACRPPRPACWRRRRSSRRWPQTWRELGTDGAAGGRPGVRIHARRPAAGTAARWIRFATELFPLATLVTPNLDEVRLLVGIDVVDAESQRDAAKALHALGPQWALVKGGHLRSSPRSSRSAVSTATSSTSSTRRE